MEQRGEEVGVEQRGEEADGVVTMGVEHGLVQRVEKVGVVQKGNGAGVTEDYGFEQTLMELGDGTGQGLMTDDMNGR